VAFTLLLKLSNHHSDVKQLTIPRGFPTPHPAPPNPEAPRPKPPGQANGNPVDERFLDHVWVGVMKSLTRGSRILDKCTGNLS
jgi:hypothetical protein